MILADRRYALLLCAYVHAIPYYYTCDNHPNSPIVIHSGVGHDITSRNENVTQFVTHGTNCHLLVP